MGRFQPRAVLLEARRSRLNWNHPESRPCMVQYAWNCGVAVLPLTPAPICLPMQVDTR
jgi:hypothetical protein